MMSRVVIRATLFLLIIIDSRIFANKQVVDVRNGQPSKLTFSVPGQIIHIRVQSAALGVKIFLFKEAQLQKFADVICYNYQLGNSSCTFNFPKISPQHSGKWKIDTWFWDHHLKLNRRQKDIFELVENEIVNASNLIGDRIYAEEGKYIALHFDDINNSRTDDGLKNDEFTVSSCELVRKNTAEKYNLDNLRDDDNQIRRFRECGIIMRIKKDSSGFWSIVERFAYKKRLIHFQVILRKPQENQIFKLSSELGFPLSFPPAKADYSPVPFELERPDGYIIPVDAALYNSFEIDELLNEDAGNWTVRLKSDKTPCLNEEKLSITLQDLPRVDTSFRINGNSIEVKIDIKHNISYGYRGLYEIQQCEFRNKKRVISIESEVWTDDIFLNEVCEFRLEDTSADDYGNCEWSIFYQNRVLSGFISIHQNMTSSKKSIKNERHVWKSLQTSKYVKSGDGFVINCTSPARLKACEIKSPENITYTGSRGLQEIFENCGPNSIYSCGCFLKMEVADFTHNGDWTCTMTADDSPSMVSTIPIYVTDSYLISEVEDVGSLEGEHSGNRTIFRCRTHPKMAYKRIKSCWWELNGRKIMESEKYKTARSYNKFSLEIKDFDRKDLGNWACFARLFNDSTREIHAFINLGAPESPKESGRIEIQFFSMQFAAMVALSCVSILIMVVILYLAWKRYKYDGYRIVESCEPMSDNHD